MQCLMYVPYTFTRNFCILPHSVFMIPRINVDFFSLYYVNEVVSVIDTQSGLYKTVTEFFNIM
jgi:hypothetical protein